MTIVKAGLIQASLNSPTDAPCETIRERMLEKHAGFLEQAGAQGVQMVCAQEVFNGPYFCPAKDDKWFAMAEGVPDGPTTRMMAEFAQRYNMVVVSPVFELDPADGRYYNTAAVIDADGRYLGKYRKTHIPSVPNGAETYYFTPSAMGYPVFDTAYGRVGVYICYDRHYPEGARILGLNGAEIVFNPSATWVAKSRHLWEVEQRALAANNAYFVGTINRVGTEAPWGLDFYGSSYFADPHGNIVTQAGDSDELLVADLDWDLITQAREHWGFDKARRPDTYAALAAPPGA